MEDERLAQAIRECDEANRKLKMIQEMTAYSSGVFTKLKNQRDVLKKKLKAHRDALEQQLAQAIRDRDELQNFKDAAISGAESMGEALKEYEADMQQIETKLAQAIRERDEAIRARQGCDQTNRSVLDQEYFAIKDQRDALEKALKFILANRTLCHSEKCIQSDHAFETCPYGQARKALLQSANAVKPQATVNSEESANT